MTDPDIVFVVTAFPVSGSRRRTYIVGVESAEKPALELAHKENCAKSGEYECLVEKLVLSTQKSEAIEKPTFELDPPWKPNWTCEDCGKDSDTQNIRKMENFTVRGKTVRSIVDVCICSNCGAEYEHSMLPDPYEAVYRTIGEI